MKKLSVCLLKYDMTEKSGGDRVAALLANALSVYFDVHLVSINGKNEQPYFSVADTVVYSPLLEGHQRIRHTLVSGCKALRRYIKENTIDVILSIGGNVNFFMWYGAKGTTTKMVFCEHYNVNVAVKDLQDRFLRFLAVKTADKIVVLNQRAKQDYIHRYSIPEEKLYVIPNWISSELLDRNPVYDTQSKKIISVGRFCKEKGYDLLVEIAAAFFKTHADWRWDIYGDGPDFDGIKALVETKQLEENLFLMGSSDHIYDLYSQYGICVMTSRNEALPMVLLEAKSQKLPTVSFDCPTGPSEIIRDGIDGFLAEAENVGQMAKKLSQLADDAALRQSFSDHSSENLQSFKYEDIIEKWRFFIENLVN